MTWSVWKVRFWVDGTMCVFRSKKDALGYLRLQTIQVLPGRRAIPLPHWN